MRPNTGHAECLSDLLVTKEHIGTTWSLFPQFIATSSQILLKRAGLKAITKFCIFCMIHKLSNIFLSRRTLKTLSDIFY